MSDSTRGNGRSRAAILERLTSARDSGGRVLEWGNDEADEVDELAADTPAKERRSPYRDQPQSYQWQDLHAFAVGRFAEAGVASKWVATRWELVSTLTSQLYASREAAVVGDFSELFPGEPLFPLLRRQLPVIQPLMEASQTPLAEVVNCDVGITLAAALLAQTGTLVLEGNTQTELASSLLPRKHWVVVPTDRIFPDVHTWVEAVRPGADRYRVFLGGPSRTADIEKTLVWGVHGPWAVSVLFYRTDLPGRE